MTIVTIGGVTVGLGILIFHLIHWFPGAKALRKDPVRHAGTLLPFLISWAYGALTILGIGGVIGWIARTALWITNWLGDAAVVWGVGGHFQERDGRAVFLPLTETGGAVVLLLTVALIAAAKKTRYGSAIARGAWCGICLGTSAGIAGFAAVPLAMGVNWLGATVYGAIA